MILKKFLLLFFIALSTFAMAEEPAITNYKFYGFVRNDFYINSRQNVESLDGLFQLFPKPIELNSANVDKNAIPQSEMLSIQTRFGLDINGSTMFGAKSSAKIEADFTGFGANFYVLRIRQAYAQLNWEKTELLVGQTWHPLYGNVIPTTPSCNNESPFQPFNRSPQVRVKYNLSTSLSLTAAAIYQMQYTSLGPLGASSSYLKNALLPNLFLGAESKTNHWISGIGMDLKTIKPTIELLTSASAVAYTQYSNSTFQLKAKALWGENLSDHRMPWGYGIGGINIATGDSTYTNFNSISSWIDAVYGTKWQVGVFVGFSQNLGTNQNLLADSNGKYIVYGAGFFTKNQQMLDRLYRIAPHVSYNLPNLKFGVEYELTSANYGMLQSTGRVANPYPVNNHRIVASMSYIF